MASETRANLKPLALHVPEPKFRPGDTVDFADVEVPADTRAEIAVLKGIVAANVMSTNARKPIYSRQRGILTELADHLWASGDAHLDPGFREDWAAASDDTARRRVIVDQVASLTDVSAVAWHDRLIG